MISRPTDKQLTALHQLTSSPQWRDVNDLFNSELASTYEKMAESHDDVTLRQFQGRAKLLKEILSLVSNLPATMEKLEARKRSS